MIDLSQSILAGEPALRLGSFAVALAAVGCGELLRPRRTLVASKKVRWFNNLAITLMNAFCIRLIFPLLPVGLALMAQEKSWGILNTVVHLPPWLAAVAGVLVLDLVIYFQHVIFHRVPLLWRLHVVHHTDLDIDVSTGLRFHPFEILISMVIKLAAVVVLGPPPVSVLVFEIILNGSSMFNHGNIFIPLWIDRFLRWIIVTPDMHRLHHSVIIRERNSNYGFYLPWWDRLFRTYRDQPEKGHDAMKIGVAWHMDPEGLSLPRLMSMPFHEKSSGRHYR